MRVSPGNRALRVGLVAVAGLLVLGCSVGALRLWPFTSPLVTPPPPPLTPSPGTSLPGGWREYREPDDGFAIALPDTWRRVDLDAPGQPAPLPAGDEGLWRPAGALAARVRGQGASGVRFFAFDLSPESVTSGFMTTVNVLHLPLSGAASLAEFGERNVRELERAARVRRPMTQERVDLPAGQALRLRYELTIDLAADEELCLSLTQFLLVWAQQGYVLTFATQPWQLEHYAPLFDEIGRSLRWLQEE